MERPAVVKSPEVARIVDAFGACAKLPHKRLGFLCREYLAMNSAQRLGLKGAFDDLMAARVVERFSASPGVIDPLYDNAAASQPLRTAFASCRKIAAPVAADAGLPNAATQATPRPRPGYVSPWVIIETPENTNV